MLRTKQHLKLNKKTFFVIFKKLPAARNCLRPKSGPLNTLLSRWKNQVKCFLSSILAQFGKSKVVDIWKWPIIYLSFIHDPLSWITTELKHNRANTQNVNEFRLIIDCFSTYWQWEISEKVAHRWSTEKMLWVPTDNEISENVTHRWYMEKMFWRNL